MIPQHADLFNPPPLVTDEVVKPWKPRPLSHEEWEGRDYRAVMAWRIKTLHMLRNDAEMLKGAWEYYKDHPVEFVCHWCDTYDPRKKRNRWMPFILFNKQAEFIEFVEELRHQGESGLVEKCRDVGASWLGVVYSVWLTTFHEEVAVGWGSRKEALVDKKGDPDSLFEKMRMSIARLPDVFRPSTSNAFLKIVNNDNGSTLTGEAGDGIGRGGRKTIFCVDEAAHIERAETIEASLADTTDVRLDLSSVNGTGNMFHRRREAGQIWTPGTQVPPGVIRVFIFDWRDHPEKTQEWYDKRKAKAEREGLQHVFAQEVDRDYNAAVENTVIAGEWIEAAIDAHLKWPALAKYASDEWMAGLDLADAGLDRNALAVRQGIILRSATEWSERDPGVTARRSITTLRDMGRRGLAIQYDSIGIGATVKSEYNRLVETGEVLAADYRMVPWHAGAAVVRPFDRVIPDDDNSIINKSMFHNMKAQAWWALRTRFYKTWRTVKFGDVYPPSELISIDSAGLGAAMLATVRKELAQATRGTVGGSMKMVVNKSPEGTKSPNSADAIVQAFFPAPEDGTQIVVGRYGA